MRISHFAVKHPAVIGMLLIVLVAFGIFSFTGLNVEFMNDISLPTVEVVAVYPGAGAQDVEQDVTNILEQNFVTLPDFKSIESTSANSYSWVTITFRDGVDPYDMLPEIRNRIRQLSDDLPDTLQGEPVALVGGATMLPIFMFSVSGGSDSGRLTKYIEETMLPRITRIPGVADASLSGGRHLETRVTLRTSDLEARGIPATQVYQALQYANTRIPVGTSAWHGNQADIRYDGSITAISELARLPVGAAGDGTIVRLEDVADVALLYEDQSYMVDADGEPRMVVSVTKRSDGNTMDIIRQIKQVLADTERETHGAVTFDILSDDSRSVTASLLTVVRSGLLGLLMAIVVIFLFLNDPRATLTIAISIPLSILFSFIGMRLAGVTINLLSLSGLVTALGMVVDGSIVMLEQVMRVHRMNKGDPETSIMEGADQVGSSILASTTTTVTVFIPLAMLTGIIGSILHDVSLALILSLTASLLVALIVVPFILRSVLRIPHLRERRTTSFHRGVAALELKYRNALDWSLSAGKFIILVSVAALAIVLSISGTLGITFIPSTDTGEFYIDMEFPTGYSVEQTREKALAAQRLVRETVDEIDTLVLFSGQGSGYGMTEPNQAYMKVVLVPRKERDRTVHEIIIEVQRLLSTSIPEVKVNTTNGGLDKLVGYAASGGGYGLKLVGDDLDLLYETAERVHAHLADDPDVISASIDTSFNNNTLVIDMSQQLMASVGVNSAEAGLTSSILFRGVDVGRMITDDGQRYTIRLQSDLTGSPITSDTLAKVTVPTASGGQVSFASLADMRPERNVSQINHSERSKTITVSATLVSENTSGVTQRMNAYLAENPLPPGVQSVSGGLVELIGDSASPMVTALAIAIFLVYTVMVLQFERFRQPLIVMVSIPFCLIGVVLGLLAFGSSLSLISFMAIVSLGGIVVNNGIILIDSINRLRGKDGKRETSGLTEDRISHLRSCVTEGSASRLRPIMMTTLTTMFGVVPMAVATGEGSALYAPLGQAIAGGLFSSTLITLFLIPVLYYMTERRILLRKAKKSAENGDVSEERS